MTAHLPTMCHHREIRSRNGCRVTLLCYEHGTHELIGSDGRAAVILTGEGPQPFNFCARHAKSAAQRYDGAVTVRAIGWS
jgi:hypothetical protein